MTYERLSLENDSMISSYSDHILRYELALPYCVGKRVLDAGCGVGYGSRYLAVNGATSVLALDISREALSEANMRFGRDNLKFQEMDVERIAELDGVFDVVVNLENLEHLRHPEKMIEGAAKVCSGTFITSTPNGATAVLDENGRPQNEYHVKEFTSQELSDLLSPRFKKVTLLGQWLTHAGKLRQVRSRELFEQLNDAYYNPINRVVRNLKRLVGRQVAEAPRFTAAADSFPGDYVIAPLVGDWPVPWEPSSLIAVCDQT